MEITRLIDTKMKKALWIVGIALVISASLLSEESTIGPGDTVVIDYVLSVNGTIIDTSNDQIAQKANIYDTERTYEPLTIVIGGNPGEAAVAPPAVERALLGMKVGEEQILRLYPLEAYGYWKEENVVKMNREEFETNSGIEPELNETYQWGNRRFTVYQLTEEFVWLDFNHRFSVIPTEVTVLREEFEESAEARVGNVVAYQGQYAVVMEVTDTEVVLDLNPAIFEFKVEIIQIKKA
ncbi:MAG: FKBP-type peptidyl-prolyl cis-trans isomerase [Theionarchaea archaeon]|nr:FKBP-type peptidyl-prolyl cis-trans isomerase [Theionarchaea archaeon]MBU7037110.1 FKBP-type peptidyl-prolyl cis-trans isomerase [Theionarchaea archaeon]